MNVLGYSQYSSTTIMTTTLLWIVICILFSFYDIFQLIYFNKIFRVTFFGSFVCFSIVNLTALVPFDSFYESTYFHLILGSVMILIKGVLTISIKFWRNSSGNYSTYIVIGYTKAGLNVYQKIDGLGLGHKFAGFFDNHTLNEKVIGKIDDVKDYCLSNKISHIHYALPYNTKIVQSLKNFADKQFIYFSLVDSLEPEDLYDKDTRKRSTLAYNHTTSNTQKERIQA
ncbi:hypothetical protein OKW21_004948 [Catalinimonas alkaloidigena]|uniref:nucleoside-diphosphate sugar epimerase/dehydratase n=1 Tax=Catalinimonas alkaloidigena TaxID=1075417 RepID=UPI0024051D76|nr:hypothetical protein [Catalinimonas alkaloidigena]MDF9799685.1 hypothetical protein [Catalinimonas alkaloidigena]